jgi:DNA-binding LacI/PurR family transcriptional regulator
MTTEHKEIGPVIAQPGQPLYESVKQALTEAINSGHYQPGIRMPSTKELSRQMSVSLVTAHRALQELVTVGVLERTRGRGTYVVENHRDIRPRLRVGVLIDPEASLANLYHSQILEGMHRAAVEHRADLVLMGHDSDIRPDAHGYVVINPTASELDDLAIRIGTKAPIVVVGAQSDRQGVTSIDTDNQDLAWQAVNHLYHLGHRRIGFIIGEIGCSNCQDRREGFINACKSLGIAEKNRPIIETDGWQLKPDDKLKLNRMLGEDGLTALFAGNYYLTLDAYQVAATMGLKVPQDLTVVGVDDPQSAAHLRPALTTLRQPLTHLGHAAIAGISKYLGEEEHRLKSQTMRSELVIRRSSGAPRQDY